MKSRKKTLNKPVDEIKNLNKEKKDHGLTIKIPLPKSALELEIENKKKVILGYRVMSEPFIIDHHQVKSLKTSVLIDSDKFPSNMRQAEANKLKQIHSHRPTAKIANISRCHSPVAVLTPKGTKLYRAARFGSLSLFSNKYESDPIVDINPKNSIEKKSDFFSSEPYESITTADKIEKIQTTTITHEKLEKRRKEDKDDNFRRYISQNKVMANPGVDAKKTGATNYVYATHLFENNIRWEWLHLVAHMISGASSQNSNNLVAGSAYSNTEMMFAEANLNYLARVYPNGFDLTVRATLIPSTHIATAIYYIIKTSDFELTFEFNTQTRNKPHINYHKYFAFISEELVRCSQLSSEKKSDSKENQPLVSSKKDSILFYTKKDISKSKIPAITNDNIEKNIAKQVKIKKPKRAVVIDTETTGLHAHHGDRVVQIGGIELIDGKPTGKEFMKIINPERSIPKSLNNEGIHHITDEVVKGKPIFKEIADEFCKFIDNAEIIGHNLPFDITMLENEFKLANRPETFIGRYATDTLKEAEYLLSKDNPKLHYNLKDLCKFYNLDDSERKNGHDALIDAKLTGQLYLKLNEHTAQAKPAVKKLENGLFAKRKKVKFDIDTSTPAGEKINKIKL